jgi:uncharacterized membrane protein YbaN (DUF454 family)
MNIRNIKKAMLLSLGIFLVLVGIIGLVLPILPGYIFIFAGITFCAKSSNRIKKKFKLDNINERLKLYISDFPIIKNYLHIE